MSGKKTNKGNEGMKNALASDKREQALKALAAVKSGATVAQACKKYSIATSTYAKYRVKNATASTKNTTPSPIQSPIQGKVSKAEAYKQSTGKDLISDVENVAKEKGFSRQKACKFLKIPYSTYAYEKAKTYNKGSRGSRKKAPIDLLVPTVEQVKSEKKAVKANDKVIVFVCNTSNLSTVLGEINND